MEFGSAVRSGRPWRLDGVLVALVVALSLLPAGTAQARHHARRCETFVLSNNANATVCAFLDAKDFGAGYRGVGTIKVDKGTAAMEIGFVHLFRDDTMVKSAAPKKTEEAASLEQLTGYYKPEYGRYKVVTGYTVGVKGGSHRSSTIESEIYELERPSGESGNPG